MPRQTKVTKQAAPEPKLPYSLQKVMLWIGFITAVVGIIAMIWNFVKSSHEDFYPKDVTLTDRVKTARKLFEKRDDFKEIACVEGNCDNGNGTLVKVDGTIYQGAFMNNLMHGQGHLIFPERHASQIDFVVADFNLGSCTGKAYIQYANGDIYEGEVAEFQPHGKGSHYDYATGQTVNSNWKNGKRE